MEHRLAFLLTYISEQRLSAKDRGWGVDLLSRVVGPAASEFLLNLARTAEHEELVAAAVNTLGRRERSESQQVEVESLFLRAAEMGWESVVEATAKTLSRAATNWPALGLVRGTFGTTWSARVCESIARELVSRVLHHRNGLTEAENIAQNGTFSRGRAALLASLDSAFSHSGWGRELRSLWDDRDPDILATVARHVVTAATQADRALLERMVLDGEFAAQSAAERALSRLK